MDSWNAVYLVLTALIVMSFTYRLPHAWLWIAVGGASYVASAMFWDYGDKAMHPFIALALDGLVCVLIFNLAKEKWELGAFFCFWASVLASLVKISGFMPTGDIYADILDFCNYMALLTIGGTGLIQWISHYDVPPVHNVNSYLRRAVHARH